MVVAVPDDAEVPNAAAALNDSNVEAVADSRAEVLPQARTKSRNSLNSMPQKSGKQRAKT